VPNDDLEPEKLHEQHAPREPKPHVETDKTTGLYNTKHPRAASGVTTPARTQSEITTTPVPQKRTGVTQAYKRMTSPVRPSSTAATVPGVVNNPPKKAPNRPVRNPALAGLVPDNNENEYDLDNILAGYDEISNNPNKNPNNFT